MTVDLEIISLYTTDNLKQTEERQTKMIFEQTQQEVKTAKLIKKLMLSNRKNQNSARIESHLKYPILFECIASELEDNLITLSECDADQELYENVVESYLYKNYMLLKTSKKSFTIYPTKHNQAF